MSDIIGNRYGLLVVLEKDFSKSRSAFLCRCDCGKEKVILRQSLVGGYTRSCGCASRKYNHPDNYDSKVYRLWHSMIRRCYDPKTNGYDLYSSKGVTVCDRWQGKDGFVNFMNDMGDRPSEDHSIDRIDNNGIYEPSNCRWATKSEQANNRSNNVPITIGGETLNLCQWAKRYKINNQTVCERIKRGWSAKDAVTIPVKIHSK